MARISYGRSSRWLSRSSTTTRIYITLIEQSFVHGLGHEKSAPAGDTREVSALSRLELDLLQPQLDAPGLSKAFNDDSPLLHPMLSQPGRLSAFSARKQSWISRYDGSEGRASTVLYALMHLSDVAMMSKPSGSRE